MPGVTAPRTASRCWGHSSLVSAPAPRIVPDCPDAQVRVFTLVPLFESSGERAKSFFTTLLSLLSLYELSLKRQYRHSNSSTRDPNADALCQKILNLLTSVSGRSIKGLRGNFTSLSNTLSDLGLAQAFPLAAAPNQEAVSQLAQVASTAGAFDLKQLSIINQVVTLALQLRSDVELSNHKYIAHQIALLYQSLTHAREDLRKYRGLIEPQFDSIKAACSSSSSNPHLSMAQTNWLQSLCTNVITDALFKGNKLSASPFIDVFLESIHP